MIFRVFLVVILLTTLLWYAGVKKTFHYLNKENKENTQYNKNDNKKSDISFKKVLSLADCAQSYRKVRQK